MKQARLIVASLVILSSLLGASALFGETANSVTLPRVIAKVSLTGQSGPIPTTTLFTPSRSGLFRVSAYLVPTVLGTYGDINYFLDWTDDIGSQTCNPTDNLGACLTIYPYGITYNADTVLVRATAGKPITYTVFYDSDGAQYSLFITVEQLM